MENSTVEVPLHYNANQLVTYKVINGDEVTYPTTKVNDLEWELEQYRRSTDKINNLQSTINKIIDNMTEEYWYNTDTDKESVLQDICDILQFNPVKTIEFRGSISISGSVEIPLNEAEDFDIESYITDAITVDSYRGDIEIDWELDGVYES
jgi:hypothetical protein